jgi:hypothetical protein
MIQKSAQKRQGPVTPLLQALATRVEGDLPLFLNELAYQQFKIMGVSKAEVQKAVNHLVSQGRAWLEPEHNGIFIRPVATAAEKEVPHGE